MTDKNINPTSILAVLLFTVMAFLYSAMPVSGKVALGSSGFSSSSELEKSDSNALTLLEKSLSYRLAALENSNVPEANLPNGSATTNVNSSRLKDDLIRVSERPLINDPTLSKEFDKLYRPNATVGSGSTADAVRHELATGNSVGGALHTQKAKDSITNLQRWVKKNPNASSNDISAAENTIRDLQNALNGN